VIFLSDNNRHLVCYPYSIENLHKMAETLKIARSWFHTDHYDIPTRRTEEVKSKTTHLGSKDLTRLARQQVIGFELQKIIYSHLINKGYRTEDGYPLKCFFCESDKLRETIIDSINGFACESKTTCDNCGRAAGYWAYGYWTE
jgi:hypothetical protein